VVDLYHWNMGADPKFTMVHKFKYKHICLTSFSKMRVDLVAQVCNAFWSIANCYTRWNCI